MLAADIALTNFDANGQNPVLHYDVAEENAAPFTISIYGSPDGVTLGTWLGDKRVEDPADLEVGTGHAVAVDNLLGTLTDDQYLVAVADMFGEVAESNEENNQRLFAGGVFIGSGGELNVHGTDADDVVDILSGETPSVNFNSESHAFTPSEISQIRFWGHGGNDQITLDSSLETPLTAFGGEGDDTLTGGAGNDTLIGGNGEDTLDGAGGDNLLYTDFVTTTTTITIGGGGPGGGGLGEPNEAPQIIEFTWALDEGVYLFTGEVIDDTDPTGYVVWFGGMLEGYNAMVCEDNSFELSVEIDFGSGGDVTAQTMGLGFLFSNLAYTYVT